MADLNGEQFLEDYPVAEPKRKNVKVPVRTNPAIPSKVIPVGYLYDLWTD